MSNQINKKRKVAIATLIFGISSIAVPILYSFGNSFSILVLEKPALPIPWGIYIFKFLYFIIITIGTILGIVGLILKPRQWNREMLKTAIGLTCTIFALFYFGQIIFFR